MREKQEHRTGKSRGAKGGWKNTKGWGIQGDKGRKRIEIEEGNKTTRYQGRLEEEE